MNQLTTQIALKASTFLVLLVYITGCASGVSNPSGVPVTEMQSDERGFVTGTGIESQDLVSVTDKMARSLVNTPEINDFSGMPRIVLDPVINNTRFPIQQGIFLTRIRTLLNSRTRGKMRFLARERMDALRAEREMKRTGELTSSSDPNVQEFKGADFFLTGKLDGQTTRTSAGTSDYVLYSFQLIDARTSEIIWEDFSELKKQGLEDASYR
ncbi:MAG TPA: penicillin-binding protein activator LpoB [Verrucomicrobiales bacterium]|nr:penicillin-binding protein activator LpoB [Pedosphaera sp.]MBL6842604.1 penicillin-binding protein activator LpoB [Verrucomicrobiae bacterium]RZO73454.1 MAG: penicillin-binding protein activator LpoB [Limisphaerales bacterium]HAO65721.1 penicillin-binding protein activator LpoB [Verrucomicrobiales bacterium]HAR00606.1 penicillin-binding protein activator LpoB [Verrucomicrobiales bacterium]|tara:strand:- start:3155 stop:3790 length:636 start_codon:yes stop_codon:yes gene_type:complete